MSDNGIDKNARLRRKRRSRQAKIGMVFLVAVIFAVGGWILISLTSDGAAKPPWSSTPQSTNPGNGSSQPNGGTQSSSPVTQQSTSPSPSPAKTLPTISPLGRQVGAIVYLDGKGLPKGTFESLKGLHATEVYLYVAYYSDAYYAIPKNPYGLALPGDTLGAAIKQLHDAGYRVIGVISSALLDWRQAPPQGLELLQDPQKPIFDPVKAGPLVEELTRSLVQYPLDGIYVGEPYWLASTSDDNKKLEWNSLYEQLLAITQEAGIPFHMIMPTFNGYYTLHSSFAALPFQTIGMDAEFAYYTPARATNIDYFNQLVAITLSLATGRDALIELNLHQGLQSTLQSTPVPPDFFAEELSLARKAGIRRVVIFASTFWAKLPNKNQYSAALADFLAP